MDQKRIKTDLKCTRSNFEKKEKPFVGLKLKGMQFSTPQREAITVLKVTEICLAKRQTEILGKIWTTTQDIRLESRLILTHFYSHLRLILLSFQLDFNSSLVQDYFRSILGSIQVHFRSILGPFQVHFRPISGPFQVHFRSILVPFKANSRSILGQ